MERSAEMVAEYGTAAEQLAALCDFFGVREHCPGCDCEVPAPLCPNGLCDECSFAADMAAGDPWSVAS